MAENSNIQWTDATWNPTSGCTKVSPGCTHCYIERTPPMRMAGRKFVAGTIPLQLHEDRLAVPLHWRKPRRVFVNSMSDLFHEDVPDDFLDRVFAVMALAPRHTFQVLTKRAERMAAYLSRHDVGGRWAWCRNPPLADPETAVGWTRNGLPNVWLGVSVEDQARKGRIDVLRHIPAAARFLSLEPLLEDLGALDLGGIHWTIIGGESGAGARPCDLAWVRSLVAQCREAGTKCFVKQLGACASDPPSGLAGHALKVPEEAAPLVSRRLRDPKGGDMTEFPDDLKVRQFPEVSR